MAARAAYRAFDSQCISAIGSEEQAVAFERAVSEAEAQNAGAALKVLEQRGHLHGGLKSAFGTLYGYSSDE